MLFYVITQGEILAATAFDVVGFDSVLMGELIFTGINMRVDMGGGYD